jgi:hypothetical protein
MRLICFGRPESALADALAAVGCELDVTRPGSADGASGSAALAGALRAAEAALQEPPDAVLVTGADDAALAAALTAVKLGIPTAWAGDAGGEPPLVARVAELRLDATADVAQRASAIRELAESKNHLRRASRA